MTTRRISIFLSAAAPAALAAAALGGAAPASAQSASAEKAGSFSIPAGRLSQSVLALSEQAGVQVVFDSDTTGEVAGNAVSGSLTLSGALNQLLSGTGLSWRWLRSGVVTIERASADGERTTGAVRVGGAQGSPYFGGAGVAAGVNGVNGSRDITATEGTGSFTSGALTIGSKVPQAMKDVPQSVSVLTNERMKQQNVTDFNTAMKQLPSVTLTQGVSSIQQSFYSRGFEINTIQVDGGAPLSTNFADNSIFGYVPQIDMSVYDHVELLRGAAGLFGGYGDPSGTVNLVRKKPLDHPQYTLEAQVGSWSNYRIVADATAPLALAGKLRGRLVMTYQDNHYFYNMAKDNKQLIYGITELDLTPTTLVTAGINYTRQDSVPWYNGLPRYRTGGDLGLPRTTSFVFPWNKWNFETTELFGSVEQKLAEDWQLKVNLTHNRQNSFMKLGFSEYAVNPANKMGPMLQGVISKFGNEQFSAEATLTGAVDLFGQRQEFVIGANRVNSDAGGNIEYPFTLLVPTPTAAAPYQPYPGGPQFYRGSPNGIRPPINVFAFKPNDPIYSEPPDRLPTTRHPLYGTVQTAIYANMRLTAFDRLHLTTGLRWSKYEFRRVDETLCTNTTGDCAGKQLGDLRSTTNTFYDSSEFSWPPSGTLSFDVTKQLTAYVGYTDIYQSQGTALDVDLKPMGPITGANWEAGLKWAGRDGRLNVSIAAYQIKKKGFAVRDGVFDASGDFIASNGKRFPNGGQIDAVHSCCYKIGDNRIFNSRGVDLDITGEVLPGWNVAASFTHNVTKNEGISFGADEGQPFLSIQPKLLYKIWMSYDFGTSRKKGALSGLTLSGGANGQTSGFRSGSGCLPEFVTVSATSGSVNCATGGTFPFEYTVPAYVVFSGRIDYRFSDKWSLSANFENILDKSYYSSVGGVASGNWYGTPRSVVATLRAKW